MIKMKRDRERVRGIVNYVTLCPRIRRPTYDSPAYISPGQPRYFSHPNVVLVMSFNYPNVTFITLSKEFDRYFIVFLYHFVDITGRTLFKNAPKISYGEY